MATISMLRPFTCKRPQAAACAGIFYSTHPSGQTVGTARARPTGSAWLDFRFGLYRDVMPQPMTIYLDEYRKKQLPTGTL
jgi:hypothetical protein